MTCKQASFGLCEFFVLFWFHLRFFPLTSVLGALRCLWDLGKKQRHFQGWHPVYSQRQQVQKQYSTFRAEHTHTYTFTCSVPHPCRLDFIYDLFEHVGSRNGDETLKMGTARRKPTVSSQFRVRLKLLVMLIRLCAQSGKKGYEIM